MPRLIFRYDNPRQDRMFYDDKFIGFRGTSGTLGLQKCPKCARENYSMNVLSGICTWCGWDVNEHNSAQNPKEKGN